MAVTDISRSGSSIQITVGGVIVKRYVNRPVEYGFDGTGLNFYISFGSPGDSFYVVGLADLTIQTAPVASATAGYAAMTTSIFP